MSLLQGWAPPQEAESFLFVWNLTRSHLKARTAAAGATGAGVQGLHPSSCAEVCRDAAPAATLGTVAQMLRAEQRALCPGHPQVWGRLGYGTRHVVGAGHLPQPCPPLGLVLSGCPSQGWDAAYHCTVTVPGGCLPTGGRAKSRPLCPQAQLLQRTPFPMDRRPSSAFGGERRDFPSWPTVAHLCL